MEKNFLRDIINNFRQQHHLYSVMRDLAYKQKECLGGGKDADIDEFLRLLRQRNDIMQELSSISQENIKLRQALLSLLEIENFTLSELKGKTDDALWEELKEVMNDLNKVLLDLSEIDHDNSVTIKDMSGLRHKNGKASYKEAQKLYHQAAKWNL